MSRIKGWKRIAFSDDFVEWESRRGGSVTIFPDYTMGCWAVGISSVVLEFPKLRYFNTFKEAYKYAVGWMKKNPDG